MFRRRLWRQRPFAVSCLPVSAALTPSAAHPRAGLHKAGDTAFLVETVREFAPRSNRFRACRARILEYGPGRPVRRFDWQTCYARAASPNRQSHRKGHLAPAPDRHLRLSTTLLHPTNRTRQENCVPVIAQRQHGPDRHRSRRSCGDLWSRWLSPA